MFIFLKFLSLLNILFLLNTLNTKSYHLFRFYTLYTYYIMNETPSLEEEIKKLDTDELANHLQNQKDLHLIKEDLDKLRNQRITGYIFLDLTKYDFLSYGLEIGPSVSLSKYAKESKEQKKRPFSSYRSLKEVLLKYGINSNSITNIPQFKSGKITNISIKIIFLLKQKIHFYT